ncbi:MAG TPA: hemagglutinin, partial [Myxococcales bacterium]|nr:hemagglutinin [Myxococcales bacterium]
MAFFVQPVSATAGVAISPAVKVEIRDQFNNRVLGSTASVTLAIGTNPGGGTLSGTLTVAAVGGVATFSTLSINKAGTGYTLTASSPGLTGATSNAFNITAAAASRLGFSTPSRTFTAGACGGLAQVITVQLQDAFGNAVNAGAAVSFTASSTSSGTVSWYTDSGCTSGAGGGSFTLGAGTSSRDVYYTDTRSGTPSISLVNGSGLTNPAPQSQTVNAAAPNRVSLVVQPSSTTAGSPISPAV